MLIALGSPACASASHSATNIGEASRIADPRVKADPLADAEVTRPDEEVAASGHDAEQAVRTPPTPAAVCERPRWPSGAVLVCPRSMAPCQWHLRTPDGGFRPLLDSDTCSDDTAGIE
jgi:hypothetical protein